MESNLSKHPPLSPVALSSPTDTRSRRDSLATASVSSQVDREQLAQTLDKIHTSASQADGLTAFDDFTPMPASAPPAEPKGSHGDIVQQGLSGLYSRIKEAVGVVGKTPAQEADQNDHDDLSKKSLSSIGHPQKAPSTSLPRGESGATNSTFNSTASSDFPLTISTSSGGITAEGHSTAPQSSKASSITTITTAASKSTSSSAQNISKIARTAAAAVVDPTVTAAAISALRDPSRAAVRTEESASHSSGRRSISKPSDGQQPLHVSTGASFYDDADSRNGAISERSAASKRSRREDNQSIEGNSDTALSPMKTTLASAGPEAPDLRTSNSGLKSAMRESLKRPAMIDRLSRSKGPGDMHSRSSSMEPGTAEPSPISTSAHNSVYHESFAHEERPQQLSSGQLRIPGTTTNEGAPEVVNARLELMRKQVLSKEFWMADET